MLSHCRYKRKVEAANFENIPHCYVESNGCPRGHHLHDIKQLVEQRNIANQALMGLTTVSK